MSELKLAIFDEVRKGHKKSENLDNGQLNALVFQQTSGLRLTFPGFLILKNIFTVYSFEIPITLKSRHQIGMANMSFPYFLTGKRLVLFSELDAMTVKLCGGIEQFLENCFNHER